MTISLLVHVATFSGQLYFRRSYFFTLLQSSYTIVTFSQLLFRSSFFFRASAFLRSSFFRTVTSSQLLFFKNSYFFRVKLLPSSHHLRIGSSLGKSYPLDGGIVLNKNICRRANFPKQVLLQSINLFRRATFWKKANFSEKQYSALPTFSGELPFQRGYLLKRRHLLQQLPFQKSYFFTTYFFRRVIFHRYNSFPQLNFPLNLSVGN